MHHTTNTHVHVHTDHLLIEQMRIDTAEIVKAISGASQPDQRIHELLLLGARVDAVANTTMDVSLVERSFEAMQTEFAQIMDNAAQRVAKTGDDLLNEDHGALTATLQRLRTDLDGTLTESQRSTLSSVEATLSKADQRQREGLERFLANHPDSPMGAIKAEILQAVRSAIEEIRRPIEDVSRSLSVQQGAEQAAEKTPSKGFAYEDLVLAELQRLTASQHDLTEKVGGTPGSQGTKKGDLLVTFADLPDGINPRLVLEAKDRSMNIAQIRSELTAALPNRDAGVAILVLSSQDNAPTARAFQIISNNQAVVVYDKQTRDTAGLEVALLWARWTLARGHSTSISDAARMHTAITRLNEAITHMAQAKKSNQQVVNKANETQQHQQWAAGIIREQITELAAIIEQDLAA